MSIRTQRLVDTPIAVIDLETTGLSAQSDRIVEIAVVRIDPGEEPRVVLDTLVNPQRRVTCSEIHGIYDDDVVGAPLFGELIGPIAEALDGAALASFNVYFDMRFLDVELESAKVPLPLPHLCLMWLRPALGLGDRASLGATCSAMGITFSPEHRAASDAMASAALWAHYLRAADAKALTTFEDLANVRDYKFMKSWDAAPIAQSFTSRRLTTALKPRRVRSKAETTATGSREQRQQTALKRYWDELTAALVDREVTLAEMTRLRRVQASTDLSPDALRYVHGRVMTGLLDEMTRDLAVDDAEVEWLANVATVLRELGWAPGDLVPRSSEPESQRPQRSRTEPPTNWWKRLLGS